MLKYFNLFRATSGIMMGGRKRTLRPMPKFGRSFIQEFSTDPAHICFGCSPANVRGLHLKFHETDVGGLGCEWNPIEGLESFPNIVHGGISATLMDEVSAVLIQAKLNALAMTVSCNVRYYAPVYSNQKIFVHANLVSRFKRNVLVSCDLYNEKGRVLSSMNGLFYIPSAEQFKRVTSLTDISPEIAKYIDPPHLKL